MEHRSFKNKCPFLTQPWFLMTEYYRFEPEGVLGLVASASATYAGELSACAALENLHLYHLKTGDLMHVLSETGNQSCVTALLGGPNGLWAAGYEDGSVRIFKLVDGVFSCQPGVVFSGHRSGVNCLAFSADGGLLASAARDGDIVVWDISAECGRHRLTGHQGPVNCLLFPKPEVLLSAGKDMLVRVWDLPSQHCVETCVQHHGEITAMQFVGSTIITAGTEKIIRFFKADFDNVAKLLLKDAQVVLTLNFSIDRYSKERVVSMDVRHGYLAVALSDRLVEVYRYDLDSAKFLRAAKLSHKARSVAISKRKPSDSIRLLVAYQSRNLVEEVEVPFDAAQSMKVVNSPLARLGHRSEVRVVAHGGSKIMTASQDIVRVWSANSKELVTSFEPSAEPVCGLIIDEVVVLGLRSGAIELWKLHNGELLKRLDEAHGGCVWSLDLGPDGKTIVSASADKTVKLFEWKRATQTLKHLKTLQMDEECLCARISPDDRFISVSLLDMTIKVFHRDSLRFHLSLYGHKLPATCLAYTADSQRLLSAGPDKSLRVWSLQFGDCRRTVHAHSETVTALQAIPGTAAQFWTASKGGDLRRWDADGANGLQRIQAIQAHQGEVLAFAVTPGLIISAGRDHAIRFFVQSDDPLFPEEEEENEHDRLIDQGLVETAEKAAAEMAEKPTTATIRAMKAGERLLEALECADRQREKEEAHLKAKEAGLPSEEPTLEPLFLAAGGNKTPAQLVMWASAMIPLADLEEALLSLPESRLPSLLHYAAEWINVIGDDSLVIASRVLTHLMRAHWRILLNHPEWRHQLQQLAAKHQAALSQWRRLIGLNKVALSIHTK